MNKLQQYIQEKLKVGSKTKISKTRYLSKNNIPKGFWTNFSCKTPEDLNDIENDIKSQKQTPKELINKITYKEQLFCYWYEAIYNNWEEGYNIFRQEIIDNGYATEDELDAVVIDTIHTFKDDKELVKNLHDYLDKYDVKIK